MDKHRCETYQKSFETARFWWIYSSKLIFDKLQLWDGWELEDEQGIYDYQNRETSSFLRSIWDLRFGKPSETGWEDTRVCTFSRSGMWATLPMYLPRWWEIRGGPQTIVAKPFNIPAETL